MNGHGRRRAESGRRTRDAGSWRRRTLRGYRLAILLLVAGLAGVAYWEVRTSEIQARLFSAEARKLTYEVRPGPSPAVRFPTAGPYDHRLGYSRIPRFLERLKAAGFQVEAQARLSPRLAEAFDRGLFPPYREKDQAGLQLLDQHDAAFYDAPYPERIYPGFASVPTLVAVTLLFIENRELLDFRQPKRNPAVEWDRLALAAYQYVLGRVDPDLNGAGGSTLATQIEKTRHSVQGYTHSPGDKLRQMLSASLRAYLDGEDTLDARQRIVVAYLNSLPLAAASGQGEVIGLAAGLRAWYGADFDRANRLVRACASAEAAPERAACAEAYRQVLSLLLAQRRPTYYLIQDPAALADLTDTYLRLLARAGIISPQLRDLALATELTLQAAPAEWSAMEARQARAAMPIRAPLAQSLGLPSLYELDRLDLMVQSSLDGTAQEAVTAALRGLRDSARAKEAGLTGYRLLGRGDPAGVVYSVSLYERGEGANWLRVQASSLDQPFNLSEGAKLDLGSTAKLRTLVTYLEVVAELHDHYAGRAASELRGSGSAPQDRLTRWALARLADAPRTSLKDFLAAALQRRYPASPGQRFFTGGGQHTFRNFDKKHDDRTLSVRAAFHSSVNLVFVRLMRDIVAYYRARLPDYSAEMFTDRRNPQREAYLRRFADHEGRVFLAKFYQRYRDLGAAELQDALLGQVKATPRRLASVLRYVAPEQSLGDFKARLSARLPGKSVSESLAQELYTSLSPDSFDLIDRSHIAGLHPLELWLAGYLGRKEGLTLSDAIAASPGQRVEAYRWLFRSRDKGAQDRRIRTMLEIEAFERIHRGWQRLGYPFDSLVPSYATALGSSADRPAALAELMAIIVNDGVRQPTKRLRRLQFAAGTPYETVLVPPRAEGARVLPVEVARTARRLLVETVERGTARRARGALKDQDGRAIPVGGKTGTGDHRHKTFGRGARLLSAKAVNRSATFVFLVGDHHYGLVTAHVIGPDAAGYRFTSALPVQLFAHLAPTLLPLIAPEPPATVIAPGSEQQATSSTTQRAAR